MIYNCPYCRKTEIVTTPVYYNELVSDKVEWYKHVCKHCDLTFYTKAD